MRAVWVAGIGGLVLGHVLWLAGITAATSTSSVSSWVLLTAAVSFVASAVLGYLGWRAYQRKSDVRAAFLWAVTASPVLLSITVLGVTYL